FVRNGIVAGVVGDLDFVVRQSEQIRRKGDFAGVAIEVHRARIEIGPCTGRRERLRIREREFVDGSTENRSAGKSHAVTAAREGIARAESGDGRGGGRNGRQGKVGEAKRVASCAQLAALGVGGDGERRAPAVRVNERRHRGDRSGGRRRLKTVGF